MGFGALHSTLRDADNTGVSTTKRATARFLFPGMAARVSASRTRRRPRPWHNRRAASMPSSAACF
jgi:hypothetical protein